MKVFQPPNLPNWVLGPVFMRLDDREVGFPDIPKRSLRPPLDLPWRPSKSSLDGDFISN